MNLHQWWDEVRHAEKIERATQELNQAKLPSFYGATYGKPYHPWSAVAGAMTPIKLFNFDVYRIKK